MHEYCRKSIMRQNISEWALKAYEHQGNLWLSWNTNAPFSTLQGQFRIYRGNTFPENPASNTRTWTPDCGHAPNSWDTGLRFRHGVHCAWVSKKPSNEGGGYAYLAKTVTHHVMGGRVTYGVDMNHAELIA